MGAALQQSALLTSVYDPALELVKWLTIRTERPQGLCWYTDGDIISARLTDATSIQFQVHCEPSSLRPWSLLTVCNARGTALRRFTPDALSDCNSGLVAAIDVLFVAISHQMPLAPPKNLPPRKESTRRGLRRVPAWIIATLSLLSHKVPF
jgi:hypothetical protein